MILVLNGADFSANNIGQIEIPMELQMHSFTKNIFSKLTKYTISSEQAIAVNKFIVMLEEQDILSHITYMGSSYLASSLEECFYDVATNTQYTDTSYATYDDSLGGIKLTASGYSISYGPNLTDIPTVNFFGSIPITNTHDYNSTCTGPYLGHLYCFQTFNTFLPICNGNYNSNNGYTINSSETGDGQPYMLWNIKSLQDFDTDGTTVNNMAMEVSGTYSKTSFEPVNEYIKWFSICSTTCYCKNFYFAGDGTSLSNTQLTALYSGMITLRTTLLALE